MKMKHLKTPQELNEASENLNISDVISSKTKNEILNLIKSLDDRGYFYIFNNREDFVEGRTDWEDLKDTCENFYYVIENIKDLLTTIPQERWGVHRTHCCFEHGCKYGDEDCPVELGLVKQDYPCEVCNDEDDF